MAERVMDGKPQFFYGYVVAAASLLIVIIAHGAQYTFGIFFQPILIEFGWTRAATSGAFSLYLILWGFLSILVGKLSDRLGPRAVMTFCGFFLGFSWRGSSVGSSGGHISPAGSAVGLRLRTHHISAMPNTSMAIDRC